MDAHQPTDPGAPLWYIGNHLPTPDLTISGQTLEDEAAQGYDMITTFITNTNFRSRIDQVSANAAAEGRTYLKIDSLDVEEVTVHPGDHISQVIGLTSEWLEFDSDDPLVSHVSKQALLYELDYAGFCGIINVIIHGPRKKGNVSQFAQVINTALSTSGYAHLSILLPLVEELSNVAEGEKYDEFSTWDTWNTIRTVCKYNSRLSLALQIPAELPTLHVMNRWFAEPIRVVLLPSSTFSPNPTGYPALSKLHQALLTKYTKQRPTPYILLSDQQVVVNQKMRYDPLSYLVYIRHLQKNQPPQSTVEKYGSGYQDYLQTPLQPLSDNLESITYEVFEKDPVKYDQYEKAIKLALASRDAASSTVVAVVGAGRGPLVSRALRAAQASGRAIMLFAIEKNPNAYVHLLRHNRDTWNGQVTVIKSDMRSWNPPFAVDILISELLGSFGDNELCPECLDGVQRVLNPSGGISIPASYSAHFTPVMAPKIHADISSRKNDPDAAETPYVVMLQSIEILAEEQYIHRAWEFTHPLPPNVLGDAAALGGGLIGLGDGGNDHNARKCKATFKVPRRGVVHGLAGYFESVLYGDVELSTRPDTIDMKSKDMISWFPIFFPLKVPLHVPDNCELDVRIWRQTSERKVWYEWVVEASVRNAGQRYPLGATDLHSSKQNGCLM
ncbi:Skb1 methyltransferase [Choiromyces venosus 120613-1]|uniref:Protein arginine N-methyltransferase n=1 Tax=Choiromyces venosus 120613-1 TaxID=1336337 RepID=A0A3N4K0H3_9PEZI|nr:Skb1 methyltransferase [Choiromyces venosus 120613-1]